MIAIVNVDKNVRDEGPHQYELRINRTVIATFMHNREDTLDVCLERAAEAYRKKKIKDLILMLEEMESKTPTTL